MSAFREFVVHHFIALVVRVLLGALLVAVVFRDGTWHCCAAANLKKVKKYLKDFKFQVIFF